jgi:hypothetical protein
VRLGPEAVKRRTARPWTIGICDRALDAKITPSMWRPDEVLSASPDDLPGSFVSWSRAAAAPLNSATERRIQDRMLLVCGARPRRRKPQHCPTEIF